jgi:hypothetical protein
MEKCDLSYSIPALMVCWCAWKISQLVKGSIAAPLKPHQLAVEVHAILSPYWVALVIVHMLFAHCIIWQLVAISWGLLSIAESALMVAMFLNPHHASMSPLELLTGLLFSLTGPLFSMYVYWIV